MTYPHPMDDQTGFEATDAEMGLTSADMDIHTEQDPTGYWVSIDRNTYDCDYDSERGFFCTDVVGYGKTPLDAIVDLLDKKEEQAEK